MCFLVRNAMIICVAFCVLASSQLTGQQVTRVIKLNSKETSQETIQQKKPVAPEDLPDPTKIAFEQITPKSEPTQTSTRNIATSNSFVPSHQQTATSTQPPKVAPQTLPQGPNVAVQPSMQQPASEIQQQGSSRVFGKPGSFPTQPKTFSAPQVSEIKPAANSWHQSNPNPNTQRYAVPAMNVSTGRIATQPSPIINTQISAPKFVNVGRQTRIEIKLVNSGTVTAHNVQLRAALPENARFVTSNPLPVENDGRELTFNLSDIQSGRYGAVTMELVPTTRKALDIETQVLVDNRQKIAVSVRQPNLTTNVTGPTQMTMGRSSKHIVTIKNTGDGIAENIQLKPTSAAQIQTSVTPQIIPALNPGQEAQVNVTAFCQHPGQYELNFNVESTGLQPTSTRRQLNVFQPEIQVLAKGPNMTYLNRSGLYSIEINNVGGSEVTNVAVTFNVPSGIKITTVSREAQINQQTGQLTWTFDKMAANGSELIQMRGLATAPGDQISKIMVRSSDTTSKEIQLKTKVAARADVKINISNLSGPIRSGNKSVFSIQIENRGSLAANNVRVHAELPTSTIPIANAEYQVNELENAIHFPPLNLKPGEKRTLKFEAGGLAQGEHVVRSVLQLGETQRRVIAEDSMFVFEADEAKVTEALKSELRR